MNENVQEVVGRVVNHLDGTALTAGSISIKYCPISSEIVM